MTSPAQRAYAAAFVAVLAATERAFADDTVRLPSDAEGVRAELTLAAPEGCFDRAELYAHVEELLGRAPFVSEQGEMRVHIAITSESDLFTSRIQVAMPYGEVLGERVVETRAGSCEGVLSALSLVVAILVDVPRHDLEVRTQAHRSALAFHVSAGAGITRGWVPGEANALVDVRAGVSSGPFAVELLALLIPDGVASLGRARARLWSGVLGGALCGFPLIVDSFRLGVCAELTGGWIAASGEGLEEVQSALVPQGTLGLGLRARWAFAPPLAVRLELGVRSTFAQHRFRLALDASDYETVFEPASFMPYVALSLDLEAR